MCLSTHTVLASSPLFAGRPVVGSSCSHYQLHYTLHWALCFPAGATKHGCEPTCDSLLQKQERWWKEQGRRGRQGPLLGSWCADVQDLGLWHQWGGKGGPLPLGSLVLATWGGHYRKAWGIFQHSCNRGMHNLQGNRVNERDSFSHLHSAM